MPYSSLYSDSEEDPKKEEGGETWGNLSSLDIVSKQTHNLLRIVRRTRCVMSFNKYP